ncbi:hypothetical protein INT82_03785 [Mannheimia haemolytica]|nr:hypothetical protein [Mannheimia haemolytica]
MEQQLNKKQQKWKNITQRFERNPLPCIALSATNDGGKNVATLGLFYEKIMLKEQRHFQDAHINLMDLAH